MRRILPYIILLICLVNGMIAGVPPLEKEISLDLKNESVISALSKIQEQTNVIFSYSTPIIKNLAPITLQIKNKSVREALSLILPNNISYKSKNNYIILKETTSNKNSETTVLKGYVYDKTTNKRIPNATIYDKNTLQSTTTDDYGFYSITIPTKKQNLVINKINYIDTTILLSDLNSNSITSIELNPSSDSTQKRDSLYWKSKMKDFSTQTNNLFKKFKGYVHTINIKDTLIQNSQISLLPFIGTNHRLSGAIYNKYSFNILGGYSKGNSLLEIGGLFNINKENVSGSQFAGLFNLVGGQVNGAQFSGLFNVVGKEVKGFQAAGLFNFNLNQVKGMQAAGLFNLNVQNVYGVSAAGLFNTSFHSTYGSQIAGLFNFVADTMSGLNIAGLFNLNNKSYKSVQLAGLFNASRIGETQLQIAGLFNYAKHVSRFQIAPFNFSDSASGTPIGVFSFVRKGLHQVEISADELFYTNLAFRTGVPQFYNVISASYSPKGSEPFWSVGYGLGTSFKIKNKLRSDIVLSQQHISKGSFYLEQSELFKLYWGIEYKVKKKVCFAFGPTLNMYLSNTNAADYSNKYSSIAPYTLFNNSINNNQNLKGWVGGKVSIRFF